jgi:RHH-type proline utilization regulon transcriptional repressor/proline dehydrogenase/delta 1-pyrroline-5-carboxylate dehydrogenase
MLGEGARTARDARRYFESYAGRHRGDRPAPPARAAARPPGISVKLSALTAFEAVEPGAGSWPNSCTLVIDLAGGAKRHDLNFTVDAERRPARTLARCDRGGVADPSLAIGTFGLAVQAYRSARSP